MGGGLFRESIDTLEGSVQHKRVDAKAQAMPEAGEAEEKIHARSVTLSSERLKVIAKMDLVETEGVRATPVDYKHGAPRETGKDGALEMWPRGPGADRAAGDCAAGRADTSAMRRWCSPEDSPAGAGSGGCGIGGGGRGGRRAGVGTGGVRDDPAAAGRFAEMRRVLAEYDLPAG